MRGIPVVCVDAFTDAPFSGNPAAVCFLEGPARDEWRQALAREMNLSETAFVERIGSNEFDLRWFTPAVEVALCGHATLAAAHMLWETGKAAQSAIVFHTKSGPLTARRVDGGIELDFPRIEPEDAETPAGLLESMGIADPVCVMKAGPDYLVEIGSEKEVAALSPDFTCLASIEMRGVIVTATTGEPGVDFVSRFFAPRAGIGEDPVTGSAHCALAPYWAGKLGKEEFCARQISKRGGRLRARLYGGRVLLTGEAVTVWSGTVSPRAGSFIDHGAK